MRLCWDDMVGFRALCKVFALSVVLTLTLASAAFAAPRTVDVSANRTVKVTPVGDRSGTAEDHSEG